MYGSVDLIDYWFLRLQLFSSSNIWENTSIIVTESICRLDNLSVYVGCIFLIAYQGNLFRNNEAN